MTERLTRMDGNAPDMQAAEALLRREVRTGLPLRRLLRLYFDPGALFKDASHGSLMVRQQARRYNARHRWMLLLYARRWLVLALFTFAGIAPLEALGMEVPAWTYLAASLAVASCIAATVSFQTVVAYVLLGMVEPRGSRFF